MAFNPFDKPIGERLTQEDLQVLVDREVGEGYYVEYKSIPPKPAKMGHSLASFANTYGGWYFIGIEEQEHKAAKVVGFSLADHRDPLATIRDVARMHIDPVPIFFPQLVTLDTGNVVLVVYVPGEQETPFVTIDGRIYRRTHDSSESIPETSRHSLDRLVDNGQSIRQRFAEFCQDHRSFSEAENETSWLSIYIAPYPQGKEPNLDMLSSSNIETLLATTTHPLPIKLGDQALGSMNVPFTAALPTFNSVILRQTSPSKIVFNQLTMELFLDGKAKFHLPFSYLSFHDSKIQQSRYDIGAGHIFDPNEYEDFDLLKFLDIGRVWLAVMWFFQFYEQWLNTTSISTSFRIAAELEEVWRVVAFVDAEEWLDAVQKTGLPVMQTNTITLPTNIKEGMVLERSKDIWMVFCEMLSQALGLTSETFRKLFAKTLVDALNKSHAKP